jgi:hypothetical protein
MAWETSGLGVVVAAAIKCHASVGPVIPLQIACGITEISVAATIVWYFNKCTDNCEHVYWDETTSWDQLKQQAQGLGADSTLHGIIVRSGGYWSKDPYGGRYWAPYVYDLRQQDGALVRLSGAATNDFRMMDGFLVEIVGKFNKSSTEVVNYKLIDTGLGHQPVVGFVVYQFPGRELCLTQDFLNCTPLTPDGYNLTHFGMKLWSIFYTPPGQTKPMTCYAGVIRSAPEDDLTIGSDYFLPEWFVNWQIEDCAANGWK